MGRNDDAPTRLLDRRQYLKLSGGLASASAVGLAGCSSAQVPGIDGDGEPAATGYLATAVTDQPTDIDDFESCVVTVDGVWLGPRTDLEGSDADDETGEDGDDEGEGDADDEGGDESDEDGTDEDGTNSTSRATASGSQPEQPGQGPGNETGPDDGDADDGGDDSDDGDAEDADGEGGDAEDAGEEEADDGDDGGEEDGEDDGNGRRYLAFDEPQEADLVDLQGDRTQLIDDREVTVGTYQFLQLDVAGVEGVLTDGTEATVDTPGEAPLKFQASFEVREGYRTTFTADFAPVRRGTGDYLIKPVASGTEVNYEAAEGGGSTGSDGTDEGSGADGDGNETTTSGTSNGTAADD